MTSYIEHAPAPTGSQPDMTALALMPFTMLQLWADSWASLIGGGAKKSAQPEAEQLPVPDPLQRTDDFA